MAHIHNVVDTDNHYKIDGITRTITNLSETKRTLVQYDHNSERFTFEMPRYVDGHDISECNLVQIHYSNLDTLGKVRRSDIFTVDDLRVNPDDPNSVLLSWLISVNATQFAGTLNFSIRFACIHDGDVDYVWNTAAFNGISILESLYNSEYIVDTNLDAITTLKNDLLAAFDAASNRLPIRYITLYADAWVGNESPYSQIVEIEGVTETSKVDLSPSAEQLEVFRAKDLALVTENDNGIVTVYAIGQKPTMDYTIQVTIAEVRT